MKNPAVAALTVVAVVAAVMTVLLVALSAAGMGQTYDYVSGTMGGGLPIWTALIPGAVAVLAGISALVVWGLSRDVRHGDGEAEQAR